MSANICHASAPKERSERNRQHLVRQMDEMKSRGCTIRQFNSAGKRRVSGALDRTVTTGHPVLSEVESTSRILSVGLGPHAGMYFGNIYVGSRPSQCWRLTTHTFVSSAAMVTARGRGRTMPQHVISYTVSKTNRTERNEIRKLSDSLQSASGKVQISKSYH
jgi:hypothetical protein